MEEAMEPPLENSDICPHFKKSVNFKLKAASAGIRINNTCIECEKKHEIMDNEDEFSNEHPPLWICLQCGHVGCGNRQNDHAKEHSEVARSDSHCLVIDTFEWSIWCYKCNKDISHPSFQKKLVDMVNCFKTLLKTNKSKKTKSKPHIPIKPIPPCQNEKSSDSEKKKILNDLPKVHGLINLGNTCFFNAVLQCLAQTPYLIKVLDDLQVPGQQFVLPGGKLKVSGDEEFNLSPIEGILDKPGDFTLVLHKTLTAMQNSGHCYRPIELLNSLRENTKQYIDGGQHDSHELLRRLLELVRNEDLKRYQAVILNKLKLKNVKRQNIDDHSLAQLKFYGTQATAKLLGTERVFGGQLVSTLECRKCHHSSTRIEPFLDISLPVLVDKSLPPILKRKNNNRENLSENISKTSKGDVEKRCTVTHRRNKMHSAKNNENCNLLNSHTNRISEENKESTNSEESDADIEDNTEGEDAIDLKFVASKKACAVISPADEHLQNDESECNLEYVQSNKNYEDYNDSSNQGKIHMINITENENNRTNELSNSTSSIIDSNFTSSEEPIVSPLSSPVTPKGGSASPVSNTMDAKNANDVVLRLDKNKKIESSDTDSLKTLNSNLINEDTTINKINITSKTKLSNGVCDITSNLTNLGLSNSYESREKYPTEEGECSIESCLNQFSAVELMDGNNQVGCTACTERENKGKKDGVKMVCTDSTKQYLISQVPAILILHLKRFQLQNFSFHKIYKHVSFPLILDLAPVSKDYTKPRIYALYGIVEHSGSLFGGHYTAYVKSRAPLSPDDPRWSFLPTKDSFENKHTSNETNLKLESNETTASNTSKIEPPPGQWYCVSDSSVYEVDEKTVLRSEAYLLFYERIL